MAIPISLLQSLAGNRQPAPLPTNRPEAGIRGRYGGSQAGQNLGNFRMSTTARDLFLPGAAPPIWFHAGPASATWTMALRATNEDIKNGQARFAQARQPGVHFDLPKVAFEFQSGNILPYVDDVTNKVTSIANGLDDFYSFLQLMNESPILPDGSPNYVIINYGSVKFPSIVLEGYWSPEGTSFPDNPSEGAQVLWGGELVVHRMNPTLWDRDSMVGAWNDYWEAEEF